MRTFYSFLIIAFFFSACSLDETDKSGNPLLNSVLWMQHAAEYKASALQAYSTAKVMLDKALEEPKWTAAAEQNNDYQELKPAIVLDVDETVLDNSPYETQLIKNGQTYSSDTWKAWCDLQRAEPIPGALEFCTYAHEKGVKVFYVTNRRENVKEATRANLKKSGFPLENDLETLIARTKSSDKGERRAAIARDFRIVLLIGDNAGDFHSGFTHASQSQRDSLVSVFAPNFGTKWIMLPNPMYGDWEGALYDYDYSLSTSEQQKVKTGKLIP